MEMKLKCLLIVCVALYLCLLLCYNGLWNLALYPFYGSLDKTVSDFVDLCRTMSPATGIAASLSAISVLEIVWIAPKDKPRSTMEMLLWSMITILLNSFTAYLISIKNASWIEKNIWMILVVTTVVNILWYYALVWSLIERKNLKKYQTISHEEQEMPVEDSTSFGEFTHETRDLVLETLRGMGCAFEEADGHSIYFDYQGERFMIEASNECLFINVYDLWWHHMLTCCDVEEFANMQKTVNRINAHANCTVLYTINQKVEEIGVHSKKNILFVRQIPDLKRYLACTLDDFFKVQRAVMTEIEKCKLTEEKQ